MAKALMRAPERVLVSYQAACRALADCVHIGEARRWADKAEAMAAMAKISRSVELMRDAKRLRLLACRRIAIIAKDMVAVKTGPGGYGPKGYLMKEFGFTQSQVQEILAVGHSPQEDFDRILNQDRPPSPSYFKRGSRSRQSYSSMGHFHAFCTRVTPQEAALRVSPRQTRAAREASDRITAWLVEFRKNLWERV